MRIPRSRSLALAAAAGAVLALVVPTAASAAYYGSETDYSAWTSGGPDSGSTCGDFLGMAVCFQPNGDKLFVKDRSADGYAAVADWQSSDGRTGACVDKLGASGTTWTVCDKDFPEKGTLKVRPARYDSGDPFDHGDWFGVLNVN